MNPRSDPHSSLGSHLLDPRDGAQLAQRWTALDVFRSAAVLLMIQGHTFTALLRPAAVDGTFHRWHSLLHGLTAPMFLLGSGLAYGLVVSRNAGSSHWRFVRRALGLLAIGFLLQLPKAPLAKILADRSLLATATQVGPLQLIAASLLLCELLRALSRSRAGWLRALGVCAFACTAGAPWVWQLRASEGPLLPLGTWLDGYAGSLFPVFPWAAFFLCGVLLAQPVQLVLRSASLQPMAASVLVMLGLGAAGVSYCLFLLGFLLLELYGEHALWQTNPLYVVFRLGVVSSWLGLLWSIEPALSRALQRNQWIARPLDALCRHSLLAYVCHLLLIYGTPFTTGLVYVGASLELWQASVVALGVGAVTTGVVMLWQGRRRASSALRARFAGSRRRGLQGQHEHRIAERERWNAGTAE